MDMYTEVSQMMEKALNVFSNDFMRTTGIPALAIAGSILLIAIVANLTTKLIVKKFNL